jgi:hypothetical protein
LFVGITAVGMLLGSAVPLILLGAAMCGINLCLLDRMRGRRVEFRRLFDGFQYFQPGLVAAVLMFGVSLLATLPIALSLSGAVIMMPLLMHGDGLTVTLGIYLAMIGVLVLVILATSLVVGAFFLYSFPLIVDRGLSGTEAVRLGARAVQANFWGTVGVLCLQVVLGMLGACFCYVGAFLVLPVTMGAVAAAYRCVFPEEAPTTGIGGAVAS